MHSRVPNGPGGLQSFGARHRRPVRGIGFGGLVRPMRKLQDQGPVQMTVVLTRVGYSISGSGVRVPGQKNLPRMSKVTKSRNKSSAEVSVAVN
jgi:hypothetical protein